LSSFFSNNLTGVAAESEPPRVFALEQDFPNPFNPATTIRYSLPHKSLVPLAVYNTLGQQLATQIKGEQEAGSYQTKFNWSALAIGVYFCRLQRDVRRHEEACAVEIISASSDGTEHRHYVLGL